MAQAGDPLELVRRRADEGDVGAMAELGARLLIGAQAPYAPLEGLAHLSAAAERDDADALGVMATLAGAGALMSQNWSASLEYLRRAAVLGAASARAQLQLLSSEPPISERDADNPDTWRRLSETIDIAAWIAPPPRRPVCETPRVRVAETFAPALICDWLVERARGRMRPAMMYDGATKTEQVDPHRTCSDYQFDILNTDLVLVLVREKIAALTKLPTVAMEPPRIFHYALGERIKPHYDRCGDGDEGYGRQGGYLGDRIVTFLLYLNDGFEGGELEFPKVGFRCKGAKGDAVYFAHVDPSGKPEPLSLHAGLTITAGEKWVLSQWIHDRPFGAVGADPG
ncbi:MAG: prolyl hydroxylase family protein [Caulobacterales bacterium]